MRRGKIVKCVEAPDYLRFLSKGKEYVVCSSTVGYITILGDDNQGHTVLSTLFIPVKSKTDLKPMVARAVEAYNAMTPDQQREMWNEQRKSWVVGEMLLEHPEMTREEAERIYQDVTIFPRRL